MDNKQTPPPPLNFGWTILSEMVFCSLAGYFADQKFGTGYKWTFVGIAVAFVLIGYEIWKLVRNENKK